MLYVFLVRSGTMMTFDMNLAMANVSVLQSAIAKTCSIAESQQVLLISGGTALKSECVVSKYSAGTDTNPIFLFTRSGLDTLDISYEQEKHISFVNMEERVKACENMAADHQTLAARSQLARDLADLSNYEYTFCQQLVDSQHLQQQGWAALVANLEDHAKNMKKAFDNFQFEAERYFEARPIYQSLLLSFPDAVTKLDSMPLLPVFLNEGDDKSTRHSLLSKYASGPAPVLLELAVLCKKWIEQLTEDTMASLKCDVSKLLNLADDSAMKEVKGIEDRLFKLNEKMTDAQKIASEQRKYAESLCAHHNRVSSINEHSVLNDLCRTHQMQLKIMLEHHKRLMENREKCQKAKFELSENLQTRIKWVAYVEQQIFNMENKFALYMEYLNRLNFQLNLIEQIHLAPEVYIKTLVEIHRRKIFSSNFSKWATNLSEHSAAMYQREVNARQTFNASYPSHIFVCDLFPGMDELPPPYATKCPDPFDLLLPEITQEDLDHLKELLPEFAHLIETPPPDLLVPQTLHNEHVSDSAISSEVPSSQGIACPTYSMTSIQSGQLFQTETFSSLGAGECPILDVLSPASSHLESSFLQPADMEVSNTKIGKGKSKKSDDSGLECKKPHLADNVVEKETFSPIAEEQNNIESDGDEFERVDSLPKIYEAMGDACMDEKPYSESDPSSKLPQTAVDVLSEGNRTEELVLSPSEGLRSPLSNVTSHDFHSTDYFFDDSMPSSYTESTGMSGAGKGQHMVKSHHVIMAELQLQLDTRSTTLNEVQGSQPVSRSEGLMKMHATLSALQKYIQDFKEQVAGDVKLLREAVLSQKTSMDSEMSAVLNDVLAAVNVMETEKERAQRDVSEKMEAAFEEILQQKDQQLLEEAEKLDLAYHKINNYSEEMSSLARKLDDSQFEVVSFKAMVEQHQNEISDFRELVAQSQATSLELGRQLEVQTSEIERLAEDSKRKQIQIEMLNIEKEHLEQDWKEKLAKEQERWAEMMQQQQQQQQQQLQKSVSLKDVGTEMDEELTGSKTNVIQEMEVSQEALEGDLMMQSDQQISAEDDEHKFAEQQEGQASSPSVVQSSCDPFSSDDVEDANASCIELQRTDVLSPLVEAVEPTEEEQTMTLSLEAGGKPHSVIPSVLVKSQSLLEKVPAAGSHPVNVSQKLLFQKVKGLEKELLKEREKLRRIFDKVSVTNNLRLSLLTCDPGDLVLFYYDEKHKNYVAFHFGNTSHFLHTDGLEILNLKIPPVTAMGWAIAVVIDKDYCLAKKKPNRYNVMHGTVFYRVKVQAWIKDAEIRGMTEQMPNFPISSPASEPLPSKSPESSGNMSASTI